MTIVGKILVFFTLIISLVVGYLVVLVHLASSDRAKENEKINNALKASVASEGAYKSQNEILVKEKSRLANELLKQGVKEADPVSFVIDNVLGQNTALKADNEAMKKRFDQTNVALADKDGQLTKLEAIVLATQLENKRRQDDYEKLRVTLQKEQDNSGKLIEAKNDAERKASQAVIEKNNALQRAFQLEEDNQKLAQDNLRLVANKGQQSVAGTSSPTGKNPPTTQVQGKVTRVEEGLINLNVGSDRGLKEGHTLEVFRLSNVPSQSVYLGTLRIMKVNPYEAVGQMMSRPNQQPVRVGDDVAPTTSVVR